jgi:hypothetical protein
MRVSITAALAAALARCALGDPGVTPASVSQEAKPGDSFDVSKVVTTPEIPPNPDIVLLVDVTGSMGDAIANVRTGLANIIATVKASQPTAQFAVAAYRDFTDPDPFTVRQQLTADGALLQTAVNGLVAGGGGDEPEAWINALWEVGTSAIPFRPDSSRVVVLVGDAPSHDPSGGHSLGDAINALLGKKIRVIAVNVGFQRLDLNGQATAVTEATGGVIIASDVDSVSDAILSGLKNLDVTVKPDIISCDASLTVSFAPTETTVPSGNTVTFTETIAVASGAPQGSTLECSVRFLLNGVPGGDAFTQHISIKVKDITPPVVACVAGPNPANKTTPNTNANFWTLTSNDNLDPTVSILVRDSVSGAEFGPYPPGTNIKLVQAPGATPNAKPGEGVVNWQITVKGCAVLVARDAAGNEATANCCARPPSPKMRW